MGEYRRPRRVHHLLARRHVGVAEPVQLVQRAALGPRRDTRCGPGRTKRWRRAADRRTARRAARPRRIPRPAGRPRAEARGGLVRACPAHRRRDRAAAAAAADHRRNGLRGLPRRRRAPARPGSCRSAAASGCCSSLLLGFGFIGWVFWYRRNDDRRPVRGAARSSSPRSSTG